ncbi:MAG: hypothetical protein V3R77_03690 [Candidatus Binatia bacterium]
MRSLTTRLVATFTAVWLAALPGCGDGTICLAGSDCRDEASGNVTLGGNILSVVVDNALRDIVVFVYTDIARDVQLPQDLACLTSDDFASMRTVIVGSSGTRSFTIENISRGDLTVVFLQDHASDPDGQIDTEDVDGGWADCSCTAPGCATNDGENAVAILDGEGRLSPVRAGQTVDIQDIEIDFPTAGATADRIEISTTPDDGSGEPSSSSGLASGGGLRIGFFSR